MVVYIREETKMTNVLKENIELAINNMDGTSGDRIEVTKQFGALLQEKLNTI